jgi:hypothetical protein
MKQPARRPWAMNISMLRLPNANITIEIPHIRKQLAVDYQENREPGIRKTWKNLQVAKETIF